MRLSESFPPDGLDSSSDYYSKWSNAESKTKPKITSRKNKYGGQSKISQIHKIPY